MSVVCNCPYCREGKKHFSVPGHDVYYVNGEFVECASCHHKVIPNTELRSMIDDVERQAAFNWSSGKRGRKPRNPNPVT